MSLRRENKRAVPEDSKSLLSAKDDKRNVSEVNTTARLHETSMATQGPSSKESPPSKPLERDALTEDKLSSQLAGFNLSNTQVQSSIHSHSQPEKRPAPTDSRRLNHHPQIIDEDTERFRLRLDELVNKFKFETLTEFMSAKRHLLDEQNTVVTQEKMIGESRYQSKCFEVAALSFS